MRHPSLNAFINDQQEANLRQLAAYLFTLPSEYPDFEMRWFTTDELGRGENAAHVPECGTAACAVGHGPVAGIEPQPGETWITYSVRAFLSAETQMIFGEVYLHEGTDGHRAWNWCFGSDWADTDNTVHGAAKRILWMLENGVPDNAEAQSERDDVLCYLDQEVPA